MPDDTCKIMQTPDLYPIFLKHPFVTTDSRNCREGSIFFALKGEKFDGNDFIGQALRNGAAFAVGDRDGLPDDKRIIRVDDALLSLQNLASYHRKQLNPEVIAITGSNGKTTTKELIAAALSTLHPVLFTQGNLNNHIGVPLTLLQIKPFHHFAVIEMGANHPGEIRTLCRIVDPDFGLITNVGRAHLEGFGSFEGVVRTKTELYEYIREKNGSVFVNADNLILKKRSRNIKNIYYGTSPEAFIQGKIIESESFLEMDWWVSQNSFKQMEDRWMAFGYHLQDERPEILFKKHRVKTQLVGNYNFENVLAAISVAVYFNPCKEALHEIFLQLNQAIAAYSPTNNRSQSLKTERNHLIIDAYNSNPSSMKAALDNFLSLNVSPKLAIIGEMKELGEYSREEHRQLVGMLRESAIDRVMLCGESFLDTNSMAPEWMVFQHTGELLDFLRSETVSGFHILIKGSRANQLEKTIEFL